MWGGSKRRDSFFCLGTSSWSCLTPYMHHSFRGEGPPKITRKVLHWNRPPNDYKASGLLLSHFPIKQPPRSSKTPAGPAHAMWDLPRRGLADGLHPDANFSRILIPASHDSYIHRMDWSLSHLDWEGWGGAKKTAPWHHSEIWSAQIITKWQWDIIYPKVTQGVSKALDIPYYLHCAWRPQSSGKLERAN